MMPRHSTRPQGAVWWQPAEVTNMCSRTWGFVLVLLLISGSGVAQQPADHLTMGSSKRLELTEVDARLVRLVIDWLADNFDFPAGSPTPRILFASAKTMEGLRYHDVRTGSPAGETSDT